MAGHTSTIVGKCIRSTYLTTEIIHMQAHALFLHMTNLVGRHLVEGSFPCLKIIHSHKFESVI